MDHGSLDVPEAGLPPPFMRYMKRLLEYIIHLWMYMWPRMLTLPVTAIHSGLKCLEASEMSASSP